MLFSTGSGDCVLPALPTSMYLWTHVIPPCAWTSGPGGEDQLKQRSEYLSKHGFVDLHSSLMVKSLTAITHFYNIKCFNLRKKTSTKREKERQLHWNFIRKWLLAQRKVKTTIFRQVLFQLKAIESFIHFIYFSDTSIFDNSQRLFEVLSSISKICCMIYHWKVEIENHQPTEK